jgi:hypothetical protein
MSNIPRSHILGFTDGETGTKLVDDGNRETLGKDIGKVRSGWNV